MNYRYDMMKRQNSSPKKDKSYITKLLKQLVGVLVVILLLMVFRFTNTDISNSINTTLKESFHKDYTTEVSEVFNKYSPGVKNAVETFVNNVDKQ